MRHLLPLLLTTLLTLVIPVLGFGTRGAAERIYYYDAYRADELLGGNTVAPGCVGTMPNYRCNFEQFLAYIWKATDNDTDPPPFPLTQPEVEDWRLTRSPGSSENFKDVPLGDLVGRLRLWIPAGDWAGYRLANERFAEDKAAYLAALAEYQSDGKGEKPKLGSSKPKAPVKVSSTLTQGVDYAGKLFPSIPPAHLGPAAYFYTMANIGQVFLNPPKDVDPDFHDIVNHATTVLNGLFDLRLQGLDKADYRPTKVAQILAPFLTTSTGHTYDVATVLTHIVIDPSRDTEYMCTASPDRDDPDQPGLSLDKGRRGGINFQATAAAISTLTGVPEAAIVTNLQQGVVAWRATTHGGSHFEALDNVVQTLISLGSSLPPFMP